MEEILSAPLPLIQKKYSVAPDMIFGWSPKVPKSSPIPLDFGLNPLPVQRDPSDQKSPVVYLGYRPQNSHSMHKYFANTSTYNYLYKSPVGIDIKYNHHNPKPKKNEGRFHGMKPENLHDIEFDSSFECGNLDKVVRVSNSEYDLYMRSDTKTYGNYKWFYFKITNKSEDQTVRLNIVNFKELHSLFSEGQKPMVKHNKHPWEILHSPVSYRPSKLNKIVKQGTYYQLSFEILLKRDDIYYISTTIPYSFSDLHNFFDATPELCVGSLGKSLSGINIPLITITNPSTFGSKKPKKYIIVQARQHPSETVSSFLMQYFIEFLISGTKEAQKLLSKYIFKIIPMVNIDGVTIGNARMSFSGDDLNRKFAEPDLVLHPEILAIKRMVENCKNDAGVFMFLDLHGHSKKKGSFMYGPYFPLHTRTYLDIRLLPKLLSEKTTIFRYYLCRFKSEWSMRQSARLVMSQNLGIKYTYTMENSLFGYLDSARVSHSFKTQDFQELARVLVIGIYEFSKAIRSSNKAQEGKRNKTRNEESVKNVEEQEGEMEGSSESDSQSESEEDCVEAKNKVIRAIKRFKSNKEATAASPRNKKHKSKSSKRIRSHNHFMNLTKNLPDLGKKQTLVRKNNSVCKATGRSGYVSPTGLASKIASLNDTITNDESYAQLSFDTKIKTPQASSLERQKTKYSKINLFEMFNTRRIVGGNLENSHSKYQKNFNLPAYFSKPLRNL